MTIAEKLVRAKNDIDEVYTAGYEKGKSELIPSGDYSEGFTAGKQAEYDAFWDAYQNNGNRTNYQMAFAGTGWSVSHFKPKYDIIATDCFEMFRGSKMNIDLAEYLESLGIEFDLSNAANFSSAFYNSEFTRLGEINTNSAAALSYAFYNCTNLVDITKLVLRENGTQTFSNVFDKCTALENITIEGTIGKSISFKDCPLTADSAISVINHLKSYNGAGDAYSQTLTFSASTWAALEALGAASPANTTWRHFVEQECAWNT